MKRKIAPAFGKMKINPRGPELRLGRRWGILAPAPSSLGLQGFLQLPAYATAFGFVFRIVGRHHSTS
jgi:hypothetical protein